MSWTEYTKYNQATESFLGGPAHEVGAELDEELRTARAPYLVAEQPGVRWRMAHSLTIATAFGSS